LANYGRLEFRFGQNGAVTMIDADGQQSGRYSTQNGAIVLSFYNDTVYYTGQIQGSTFSGVGENSSGSWNFRVTMSSPAGQGRPMQRMPFPTRPVGGDEDQDLGERDFERMPFQMPSTRQPVRPPSSRPLSRPPQEMFPDVPGLD
jgi:hypothetical protein